MTATAKKKAAKPATVKKQNGTLSAAREKRVSKAVADVKKTEKNLDEEKALSVARQLIRWSDGTRKSKPHGVVGVTKKEFDALQDALGV